MAVEDSPPLRRVLPIVAGIAFAAAAPAAPPVGAPLTRMPFAIPYCAEFLCPERSPFFSCCVLAMSTGATSMAAEPAIRILPAEVASAAFPRGIAASDLKLDPSWDWQALVCGEGCMLLPVRLRLKPVRIHPHDGEPVPGHVLGFDRSFDARPLVLLHDLAGKLVPEPKTYLHSAMKEYASPGAPGTLDIFIPMGSAAQARIVPRLVVRDKDVHALNVYLEYGSRRQRLGELTVDAVEGPQTLPRGPQLLRWAGDLDGDDELDLILSFHLRTGTDATATLFLSTAAGPGELVGEVATFYYWPVDNPGC